MIDGKKTYIVGMFLILAGVLGVVERFAPICWLPKRSQEVIELYILGGAALCTISHKIEKVTKALKGILSRLHRL